MSKKKVIQKNLRFPVSVISVLEKDGEKFGFNFNDYAKYIIMKKFEEIIERRDSKENLIEDILESNKQYKEGKLPFADSLEEIEKYVDSVIEE